MGSAGRGRDPARERFWREQVQGQTASGLSVGAYCRRHRLRPSAFYYWRRALAKGRRPGGEGFVPVTVADGASCATGAMGGPRAAEGDGHHDAQAEVGRGGRIEILLGNGRRVRVTGPVDREALAAVLAVVEGVQC